ncbi:hypothetical protein BSDG_04620 [Parabacteroides sp. 2_1_7]|nr:hypothetical protein BSDG_04620 [Parabacteroides sp. 2_1_7]
MVIKLTISWRNSVYCLALKSKVLWLVYFVFY